ncbi:hypothetical protein CA267_003605 [Alteromonas pelagimontana]|uniref:Uncharacterized protein n=1 Tax=Alteromonas pelagimontana TaxID=1858656 RepID=A0A6M4MBL9_9ALTE|nr:hypothetical protein [Alteromonas pelagimontana]QJR79935.1 hypothetical protein CA267_003605 [Alteromonas pelagimontana]
MSGLLSQYQIAVLQQMGICVWESQDKRDTSLLQTTSELSQDQKHPVNLTPPGQPISQQDKPRQTSAQRLAGLRSALAGSEHSDAASQPTLKNRPAKENVPAAASELAFTQVQKQQYAAFCKDVEQVIRTLNDKLQDMPLQWFTGSALRVKANQIVLTALPDKLTPQDKRLLWQKICQLGDQAE